MNYSNMVLEDLEKYPELEIIDAQKIYNKKFEEIPEPTFYKVLSRLAKDGNIERITKGIYCKPKQGKFGKIISSDKHILEYYLGENKNKGVIISYGLFNKYGLTTQVSKKIEMYSNVLNQENRNVRNVSIKKANIRFDNRTIKIIELLEILQEYKNIEDLNNINLINFIKKAVNYYDEQTFTRVIKNISFKKSTIASLKNVLDFFNVENNIKTHLNGTTKYDAINMEELYETTL